jgi:hypothetical protein
MCSDVKFTTDSVNVTLKAFKSDEVVDAKRFSNEVFVPVHQNLPSDYPLPKTINLGLDVVVWRIEEVKKRRY